MHIFQELKTLILHIYFKTIVIDNLHLFRKWRGSSPVFMAESLVRIGSGMNWPFKMNNWKGNIVMEEKV